MLHLEIPAKNFSLFVSFLLFQKAENIPSSFQQVICMFVLEFRKLQHHLQDQGLHASDFFD